MNKLLNTVQTEFEMESYEIGNEKLISENQKLTLNPGISLTSRDYELLRFLLEMKFASEQEICFKFFRNCGAKQILASLAEILSLSVGARSAATLVFVDATTSGS